LAGLKKKFRKKPSINHKKMDIQGASAKMAPRGEKIPFFFI